MMQHESNQANIQHHAIGSNNGIPNPFGGDAHNRNTTHNSINNNNYNQSVDPRCDDINIVVDYWNNNKDD